MSVKPGDSKSVVLLPLRKRIKQSPDVVLFTITDHDLVSAPFAGEGIRMTITMKRKIMSEMMTTYFPSLLLMMITYATTFFKPFFFEAALSVNLTTMLVMTTIFISKMEGLPPTSTTKMIDFWLIQCQLVPFAQVVLLTVKEHLREGPQGIWGNDDIKDPPARKNILDITPLEGETIPKEAWTITKFKSSKAESLTMLTMIGEVLG